MAGTILNSRGWVDGDGYDQLLHAAEVLAVDTFVVIADDRLFSRLSVRASATTCAATPCCRQPFTPPRARSPCAPPASTCGLPLACTPRTVLRGRMQTHFANRDVNVLRAPKSGGVVARSRAFRHECQLETLRHYFYGISGQLCPHLTVLPFSAVTLASIEPAPPPPPDTLPLGAVAPPRHAVRIVKLGDKSWPAQLKAILAVSFATSADEETVLAANVAGIVYVTQVDTENLRVTVLAPSPSALPGGPVLLTGDIKWLEAR